MITKQIKRNLLNNRNKKQVILILLMLSLFITGCSARPFPKAESLTLTLAVFTQGSQTSGSRLLQWVNSYNENNSNVNIEIVNYLDNYPDPIEALNQIKVEVIAGKGPDMIDFGRYLYSPADASSGIMADLYPFIHNDESFDKQDFYYNILEAFEVGDSLYALVPGFCIDSFATVNSALSGLERIDVRQLVEAYNMLDDESILFPGETKKDVLAMICYGSLENYVDWGEGVCCFEGDSFIDVLKFANQFPLNLNITNDYSAKSIITEGRSLLYPVCIDSVYETAKIRMLYGETPTYIGYPLDDGNGNMAAIADIAVGITSTSKHKEEAWSFLRSLLDSEFQDNTKNGLPLRVSSLEQKLEDALSAEIDSNGQKAVKERLIWDGEDPVNIYEIIEEDAETLKSIIHKVEFNATIDRALYGIIMEEADYMFNDSRKVDNVADIIQNRASLYINENK